MVKMNSRLVIKENFDEADLSDDVDDEVFVRDGKKNMVKIDKQKCDEQPLMPARKKLRQRQNSASPEVHSRQPCNIYNCLLPVYFAVAAVISIAFLMLLYIFLVDKVPVLVNRMGWWSMNESLFNSTTIPCNEFKLSRIWAQKIPKLLSDSQIKMIDIDKDGIDDVIVGTGTEMEDAARSARSCNREYRYAKTDKCLGGVLALNGKTGSMLWKLWLTRMVLSVHCDFEITGDGVPDCVITGKNGLLIAVSGVSGELIWEHRSVSPYDLFNVLIIDDVNYDGYKDILASYYSLDETRNHRSSILIVGGRRGEILHELQIPAFEAILHAPQIIMYDLDGSESVIFVTGGPEHPGGLYSISMADLLRSSAKSTQHSDGQQYIKTLFHFNTGILAAPIMADINLDGVVDIIFLAANTTFAVDGYNLQTIWNVSLYDYVPKTYSILATSSVTPTYFNDDDVPDFLITFSVGSGYPAYYYSVINVLNGKNGQALMEKPIIRSGVADTVGGIALSFNGAGNDAFLYWVSSCKNHVSADTPYEFMPEEKRQFFTDLCGLRFNSTSQLQLFALNQHVEPPGVILRSENWHESWDYDIRENLLDAANEQATLFYRINAQDVYHRPQLPPDVDNADDGQYAPDNDRVSWKVRKNGYQNNGAPVVVMNDLPEQPPNVADYALDNDIPINGRNEKEYDVPNDSGLRLKRNSIPSDDAADDTNKMLPKVSSSGVLTKSVEANALGIDVILMHYEVLANPDSCIVVNKEERCSNRNGYMTPKAKHYGISSAEKDQQNFRKNNMYGEKVSPMSNIYISRYHITCNCVYLEPEHGQKCAKMLPYEEQRYPAYLGPYGYSVFRRRDRI